MIDALSKAEYKGLELGYTSRIDERRRNMVESQQGDNHHGDMLGRTAAEK